MIIYVDIDNTICQTEGSDYINSKPIKKYIGKINNLYGGNSGKDWSELTNKQLTEWGCLYHEVIMNNKPSYDLLICDKTKRIEEI
jgi:hypothetical protein